jgi:hypothetical protein
MKTVPGKELIISMRRYILKSSLALSFLVLLMLPGEIRAQFNYTIDDNGAVTITGYTGPGGAVAIPSSIYGFPVTGIGGGAFVYNSTVTSVSIPASVRNIGSRPFFACGKLYAITVDVSNPAVSSLDGVLFDRNQTSLIQFPGAKAGHYSIPNSVSNIGSYAFSECDLLTGVTIPNSVVRIEDSAFWGCLGITNLTVPANVASMGSAVFEHCNSLTRVIISNAVIGEQEFYSCPALNSVTIENGVKSIPTVAFAYCTSLTTFTIPNSATNIGNYAFQNCSGLTSVMIGSGIVKIEGFVFQGCTNLTSTFFRGNAPALQGNAFDGENAVIYYLPGTTGWSFNFGGRIAILWNPQIVAPAVRTNQCGFAITGTANIPIVVEAITNLQGASWTSMQSCTITNGSIYFSDSQSTNYSNRFYRIRSPQSQVPSHNNDPGQSRGIASDHIHLPNRIFY